MNESSGVSAVKPVLGIMLSFGGFAGSILTLMEKLSVCVGFAGAVFGALAGYYTWRLQRLRSRRLIAHQEQLCRECRLTRNADLCPYPTAERPKSCWATDETYSE